MSIPITDKYLLQKPQYANEAERTEQNHVPGVGQEIGEVWRQYRQEVYYTEETQRIVPGTW